MKKIYLFISLMCSFIAFAQGNNKEVLFTINNTPQYSDEFVRVYKKNLDLVKDESQKEVNQYLDLYINYKIKVMKAHQLGLHENQKYKNELQSYRSQLAKGYMVDKKVTEELVQEAYNRMKFEVKASHILIKADLNASPADTLKAYNLLLDIKKRAENGEDFGVLAEQFSQDPSAKMNKGNLGYFSAFKMVYPFENAAFQTQKNKISNIVRTRFGFHLLKVEDIRQTKGEVEVAHIMLFKPKSDTVKVNPGLKILEVYAKLKQGEKFESLAEMYSEDKGSSTKGGKLDVFGSGDVGSEIFEEKSFGLETEGQYTYPFESEYGWHIVKLIKKHPLKSLELLRKEIERKISSDDRSIVIKKSFTENLRNKYKITDSPKVLKKISKSVNDTYYNEKWEIPQDQKENKEVVFELEKNKILAKDFLEYLFAQQKFKVGIKPINELVNFYYNKFKDEKLYLHHNQNLENEYPEFKAVMDEYKEGILLFDLMEKEIWNKAKTDTLGLSNYFEKNRDKYMWQEKYEVQIVSGTNKKNIEEAAKYLKKGKDEAFIKQKLNEKDKINVMIESGLFEKGSNKIPANYQFKLGLSEVFSNGDYYYVIKGISSKPSEPKKLSEVKGKVISDYQQFLEINWVDELKKEFKVEVNSTVLENLKNTLK